MSNLKEISSQFQLDVDEQDVMGRISVAPHLDLVQAFQEAVARREGICNGNMVHEPPAARKGPRAGPKQDTGCDGDN